MQQQKIDKLQAMIRWADFLNEATKQVFLNKIPYLSENKFEDLYEIFEEDEKKRQSLTKKRNDLFLNYKAKVTGIYHAAKQIVISLKEKAFTKLEEKELKNLDQELSQL